MNGATRHPVSKPKPKICVDPSQCLKLSQHRYYFDPVQHHRIIVVTSSPTTGKVEDSVVTASLIYTHARGRAAVLIRIRWVLFASTLMVGQLTTGRWFAMPDQKIDINAMARHPGSASRNAGHGVAVGTTPTIDTGFRSVSPGI